MVVTGTSAENDPNSVFQIIVECDRLIYFSKGFQHITQLDKGFHLVYNMMGIGYQMVT